MKNYEKFRKFCLKKLKEYDLRNESAQYSVFYYNKHYVVKPKVKSINGMSFDFDFEIVNQQ